MVSCNYTRIVLFEKCPLTVKILSNIEHLKYDSGKIFIVERIFLHDENLFRIIEGDKKGKAISMKNCKIISGN